MHSLSRRLLLTVSAPLALFFGLMMWVLDTGFQKLSDRSLHETLDAAMVTLIAAAEPQPNGGYAPPPGAIDPRLLRPHSGLYAQIRSPHHLWRSPSTSGMAFDVPVTSRDDTHELAFGSLGPEKVAVESRTVRFADDPDGSRTLTFSVAAGLSPYVQQLWRFRQQLIGWFGGLMALLLVVLAALLHWVLRPVRRMEREIHEVEEGRSEALGGGYPRELARVTANLNTLLLGERRRVARYRDTLGNLAHSLKTPLAVLRASAPAPVPAATLNAEIERMSAIIDHQLKRAASGGALLGQVPVDVAQVAAELRPALLKVYGGKDLALELAIAPETHFVGDRGDLTELLGNLLDNACKWCRGRVRLTASIVPGAGARECLSLIVEDDGPGISAPDRVRVLGRGVRVDEKVPGHGLGLAMVRDTIELYGGSLEINASPLGGARFALRLPGR